MGFEGAIWAVGGSNEDLEPYGSTEYLDISAGRWVFGPPLCLARFALAAATAGGVLYAIGGTPAKNVVEALQSSRGSWALPQPLQQGRYSHAAVAHAGRIYVLGGPRLSSMEVFDPNRSSWEEAPAMKQARNALTAAVHSEE